MAYVAFRFEPKFAIPVLIALFHDLLITSGVYSLTGREVTTSTVAALLTILGYSLYDTVIVFDRVRENAPRMPRATFSQIVNRSMSEVLTRSLATSFSTLLPVSALFLFGGETLKDFAFALLVGIASGTYSSIFIASPVLTAWKERESVYTQRRRRVIEAFGMVPAFAVATTAGVETPVGGLGLGRSGRRPDGRGDGDAAITGDEEEPEREPLEHGEDVLDEEAEAAEAEVTTAPIAGDGRGRGGADGRGGEDALPSRTPAQKPAGEARKKRSRQQRRRKHGRRR